MATTAKVGALVGQGTAKHSRHSRRSRQWKARQGQHLWRHDRLSGRETIVVRVHLQNLNECRFGLRNVCVGRGRTGDHSFGSDNIVAKMLLKMFSPVSSSS